MRLDGLVRSRSQTIDKNRGNVCLYKGFIPYNPHPLHNTNRRAELDKLRNVIKFQKVSFILLQKAAYLWAEKLKKILI